MFYDGGTWHVVHTFFIHFVKKFCVAVAADTGILYTLVTNVGVEAKGQLAINNGPDDIADLVKGKQFAIGVFAACVGSVTNNGQLDSKSPWKA